MSAAVLLYQLSVAELRIAQETVTAHHYLHAPVDARCSVEGYGVRILATAGFVGYLLLGRPEATRCYPWYGSVADVAVGRASCSRWEVLNLARVWLSPAVQPGGILYHARLLPGFTDRRGVWRSTLASTAIRQCAVRVGYDYLRARPPCFLDEPYALRWLLSYCDPRIHRGTLYRAAGFDLARTNAAGLQTWRIALPPLTPSQDATIRHHALYHPRSVAHRSQRAVSYCQEGLL